MPDRRAEPARRGASEGRLAVHGRRWPRPGPSSTARSRSTLRIPGDQLRVPGRGDSLVRAGRAGSRSSSARASARPSTADRRTSHADAAAAHAPRLQPRPGPARERIRRPARDAPVSRSGSRTCSSRKTGARATSAARVPEKGPAEGLTTIPASPGRALRRAAAALLAGECAGADRLRGLRVPCAPGGAPGAPESRAPLRAVRADLRAPTSRFARAARGRAGPRHGRWPAVRDARRASRSRVIDSTPCEQHGPWSRAASASTSRRCPPAATTSRSRRGRRGTATRWRRAPLQHRLAAASRGSATRASSSRRCTSCSTTPTEELRYSRCTPGEQEAYLDGFWRDRDPTPDTAAERGRATVPRARRSYANDALSARASSRGCSPTWAAIYVRYGEPDEIRQQVIPTGDESLQSVAARNLLSEDDPTYVQLRKPGGLGADERPFEVWTYDRAMRVRRGPRAPRLASACCRASSCSSTSAATGTTRSATPASSDCGLRPRGLPAGP